MDQVQIDKKISSGAVGSVYAGRYGKKPVIIKVAHTPEESVGGVVENLYEFDKFARTEPQHFMTLVAATIIPRCSYEHPIPSWIKDLKKKDGPKAIEWYTKLHKSRVCMQLIYEPVLDGTLSSIYQAIDAKIYGKTVDFAFAKLSMSLIYSVYAQIYYCFHKLHQAGWHHNDMHTMNIMCGTTKSKTVSLKIGKETIKCETYGKFWYIGDYDDSVCRLAGFKGDQYWHLAYQIHDILFQPFRGQMSKDKLGVERLALGKKIRKAAPQLAKHLVKPMSDEPLTSAALLSALCLLFEPELYFRIHKMTGPTYEKLFATTVELNSLVDRDVFVFLVENMHKHVSMIRVLARAARMPR